VNSSIPEKFDCIDILSTSISSCKYQQVSSSSQVCRSVAFIGTDDNYRLTGCVTSANTKVLVYVMYSRF